MRWNYGVVFILLLFFISSNVYGQNVFLEWNRFFQKGISLGPSTSDIYGNIYISVQNSVNETKFEVLKFDREGKFLKTISLDGKYKGSSGRAVAVDKQKNILIVGTTSKSWGYPINPFSDSTEVIIAKFAQDGKLLWHTFLGGNGQDSGNDIELDKNGNIFIIGDSVETWGDPIRAHSGENYYNILMAKLSHQGKLLWHTFLGSGNGRSISLDKKNNIYIAGNTHKSWGEPRSEFSGIGSDIVLCKLTKNGELSWNTFLGGSAGDSIADLAIDDAMNIYISGSSEGGWGNPTRKYEELFDMVVAKINKNGYLEWNTFFGGGGNNYLYSLSLRNSEYIYVLGWSEVEWGFPLNPMSGRGDLNIIKLNKNGYLKWQTFYGCVYSDYPNSIEILRNGEFLITADSSYIWGNPITPIPSNEYGGYDYIFKLIDDSDRVRKKYIIQALIKEGEGSVDREHQFIYDGDAGVINIFPSGSYKVNKIFDNDIEVNISEPFNNPFLIFNIEEDHLVDIYLKRELNIPYAYIIAKIKTDKSWIIKKKYIELRIAIYPNAPSIEVEKYILYKKIDEWKVIDTYYKWGNYYFQDHNVPSGKRIQYKLIGYAPDGSFVMESETITVSD